MAMKINLRKIQMVDVDVGISLRKGSDAEVDMDDVSMTRGGTLLVERDEPSLAQQIGLPADTPPELLADVIRDLRKIPDLQTGERLAALKTSPIWTFIERSSDATTVIQGLFALAASAF